MDFNVAHGTILACLQVFHDTTFTDCTRERKRKTFHSLSDDSLRLKYEPILVERQKAFYTLMNKNGFTFWPTPFKLTCVQTLCNCCGIYEVTRTKVADNVFVQVLDLQLDLLLLGRTERCFKSWKNVDEHNASLSSFKLRANISPHLTLTINI